MEFIKQQPSSKAPADWFTGDVWWDVIVAGQEPSRMRANLVRFSPGARTNWHSHAVGQTLHVVSGIALGRKRTGAGHVARPRPAGPAPDHSPSRRFGRTSRAHPGCGPGRREPHPASGNPLVLTSRTAEYRDAVDPPANAGVPVRLIGAAGIELDAVAPEEAAAYLRRDAGGEGTLPPSGGGPCSSFYPPTTPSVRRCRRP